MAEKPFQFSVAELLLLTAVVPLWIVPAKLIGASPVWGGTTRGTGVALAVFSGIAAALYRLTRNFRYGWAIAAIAAPALAFGILCFVAVLNYALS